MFTLPAEIADIAAQNKALVYDLLFRAASQTMLTIAADPRHLGARIGIGVSAVKNDVMVSVEGGPVRQDIQQAFVEKAIAKLSK